MNKLFMRNYSIPNSYSSFSLGINHMSHFTVAIFFDILHWCLCDRVSGCSLLKSTLSSLSAIICPY